MGNPQTNQRSRRITGWVTRALACLGLVGATSHETHFVPFTAQTRMSGGNLNGFEIRKGAGDGVQAYLLEHGRDVSAEVKAVVERIARSGATPPVVAEKDAAS